MLREEGGGAQTEGVMGNWKLENETGLSVHSNESYLLYISLAVFTLARDR